MTVHRMLAEMPSAELIEWIAYFRLQDDKEKDRLDYEMKQEASDKEKDDSVRQFLMSRFGNK